MEVEGQDAVQPRAEPVTERRNPASAGIESMDTLSMLRVMNEQDALVARSVELQLSPIARLVDECASRLERGGRLVYVGAGTSGRLAVLDAVECVPTFGIDANTVVAVLAGGEAALTRAVEGAEDDVAAGERAVAELQVGGRDVVVGVSASGRAAFVRAALQAGRERGAFTAMITCNPQAEGLPPADLRIVIDVGPEVIAGSTRLKAGTAQKMVLNMVSTATMVKLGRTLGNAMIGVRPTNQKLRERAVALVTKLAGVDPMAARTALEEADWEAGKAALALVLGSQEAAQAAIGRAGGVSGALRVHRILMPD